METADLYRWMEDPSLLSEDTLQELEKLVETYPYFSTARLLYLKNLAVAKDIRLEEEIKKMAVYVPDRRKLFNWLEGEKYGLKPQPLQKETAAVEDTFSLIDAFLSSNADPNPEEKLPVADSPLVFHPTASSDYIHWSLSEAEEKTEEAVSAPQLQHQDLIDSFLREDEQKATVGLSRLMRKEPQNSPLVKNHSASEKEPPSENAAVEEKKEIRPEKPGEAERAEESGKAQAFEEAKTPESIRELDESHAKSLSDSYFTETLARIYVKQKRYEKALQIIKNLSLKYPEKNVYFADQIRFLEKLIINTKK